MIRKLKGLLKFAISLIVIFVVGRIIWSYAHDDKNEEYLMENMYNLSEYEESLKGEASDIDGMSKYDKYQMGLDPSDGADSDADGLTDKEEIEVYHSDPTKNSTSGDLYSDGYKVEHNMDLNTYYDFKNDIEFTGNQNNEVILKAENSIDFNAVVADYSGSTMYNLENKDVIKVYTVFCYTGHITIDLGLIDPELTADSVNVYVDTFDGNDASSVKFTSEENKITLSESYPAGMRYTVYLVKEKPGKKTKKATVTFGSVLNEDGKAEGGYGVLYGWFTNLKIKYVETENTEIGEAAKQKLVEAANEILSERHTTISEKDIIATTKEDVNKTIEFSKSLPTLREPFPLITEYNGHVDDFYSYGGVYTWYVYEEDVFGMNAKEKEYRPVTGKSSLSSAKLMNRTFVGGFSPKTDTLNFPNFSTEIGTGGVCAGIAHLTSSLFNNGTLTLTSDTFEYNGKTYSFDITQDAENSTLLDRGLSDYKKSSFVKKHKDKNGYLAKKLSSGEESFATMISRYWQISNAQVDYKKVGLGHAGRNGDTKDTYTMLTYDGTVVRSILGQLDNGRICDAYFVVTKRKKIEKTGTGHAVNIFGYETYQPENPNTQGWIFYVYDSNHPDVVGTLTCEIFTNSYGEEYLAYYLDVPGASYIATSNRECLTNVGGLNMFVVLDSELNVLPN